MLSKKKSSSFSNIILDIFQEEMIWENIDLNVKLIIPKNTIVSYQHLLELLAKKMNMSLEKLLDGRKIENCRNSLREYLKGNQLRCIKGWILKNPNEKLLKNQKQTKANFGKASKATRSSQKQKLLDQGGYTFYNEKYSTISPVHVKANQYSSFIDLIMDCIELHPIHDRPINLENCNQSHKDKIKTGFSSIFQNESLSYYGWKAKKTSDFFLLTNQDSQQNLELYHSVSKQQDVLTQYIQKLPIKSKDPIFIDNLKFLLEPCTEWFKLNFPDTINQYWFQFLKAMVIQKPSVFPLEKKYIEQEFVAFSSPKNWVGSKKDFIHFVATTPSLYYTLCLWFLENPIDLNEPHLHTLYTETHHIIPKYMNKNHDLKANINKSYFLIRVPYLIHGLLHAIRFIEFQYYEDYGFINYICGYLKNAKCEPFSYNFSYPKNSPELYSVIVNFTQILKNTIADPTDFEKKKKAK